MSHQSKKTTASVTWYGSKKEDKEKKETPKK